MLTLLFNQQKVAAAVGSGGATSGGSAAVAFVVAVTAIGGAVSGGTAPIVRVDAVLAAGGAASAGVASSSRVQAVTTSGSAVSGGAAVVTFIPAVVEQPQQSSGGGGGAPIRLRGARGFFDPYAPHLGWQLPAPRRFVVVGSGGVHAGGEAGFAFVRRPRPALMVVGSPIFVEGPRVVFSGPLVVKLRSKREIKLQRPDLVAQYVPGLKTVIARFFRDQAAVLSDAGREYLDGRVHRSWTTYERSIAADVVDKTPGVLRKQKADGWISIDWSALVPDVEPHLKEIFASSGQSAYNELTSGPFDQVNERAADYAKKRAAELVGKKWVDGKLVDNPNARWAITDTTRDRLRSLTEQALTDGWTPDELADRITEVIDDEVRAEMIAETELAKAQTSGSIDAWRESGLVSGKVWLLSNDHSAPCECDDNADAGVIDLDDVFPSGDDAPPAHPACQCDVVAELAEVSENEAA